MLFNNPKFFIFLIVVIILLLFGNKTYKKFVLLISSYVFYGLWDWRFLSLIALSTIIDFLLGNQINKTVLPTKRKILLSVSVVSNLGILAFFKYYNFFIDSLQEFIFLFTENSINYNTLNIILPVGISFYTFQTMSYTIDIYRKNLNPSNSILDFAIFVSFFPQLVAGPIERAKNLLHQISNFSGIKIQNFKNSFILFFTGYIQKVLIADNLAPISDNCFTNFNELDSIYLISGLIVFSFQIYFDFAGYSNIARGIARIFGIELMINFNQPYFSSNLSEFWKRWHISLSTWLKDYLYIPLGGNKRGDLRTYNNLMITMLLGGLWHGASWNFVLWGGLHGSYLIFYKLFSSNKKESKSKFSIKIFNIIFVYFLVLLTWLPFRTTNISDTYNFLLGIINWNGIIPISELLFILFLFIILLLIDLPAYLSKSHEYLLKLPRWFQFSIYVIGTLGIALTLLLNQNDVRPFIYFQF